MKALLDQKRITRLKEVRQQEKEVASRLRIEVKKRREKQAKHLKTHLEREFEENKENHVQVLQAELDRRLKQVGNAHNIKEKNCGEKKELSEEVLLKTQQRYKGAMSRVLQEQAVKNTYVQKQKDLREKIHGIETERKELVLAQPKQNDDVISKLKPIRVGGVNSTRGSIETFMSTRYHLGESNYTAYPEVMVEKVSEEDQIDAITAANEEKTRREISKEKHDRQIEERKEKAEIRHLCAKKDVILKREKETLIEELKALELKDRNTKCETLRNIPKKVFQPPRQRYEEEQLKRMQLEHAFENIYNVKADDVREFQLPNFVEPKEDIAEFPDEERKQTVALRDDIVPASTAIPTHSPSSSSLSADDDVGVAVGGGQPLFTDRKTLRKELYVINEDESIIQTPPSITSSKTESLLEEESTQTPSIMSSRGSSNVESPREDNTQTPSIMSSEMSSNIESPLDSSLISMNIESAACSLRTTDEINESSSTSGICPPAPRSERKNINNYVQTRLMNLQKQQSTNQDAQHVRVQGYDNVRVQGYDNVRVQGYPSTVLREDMSSFGSAFESLASETVEAKTDTSSILDENLGNGLKQRPILSQGAPASMSPHIINADSEEDSKLSGEHSTGEMSPQKTEHRLNEDAPATDRNGDYTTANKHTKGRNATASDLQSKEMKERNGTVSDGSVGSNPVIEESVCSRSLSKTMRELKEVREKKEELRKYYASLIEKIQGCRGDVKEKGERLARRQEDNEKLSNANKKQSDETGSNTTSSSTSEPETRRVWNLEKSAVQSKSTFERISKTDAVVNTTRTTSTTSCSSLSPNVIYSPVCTSFNQFVPVCTSFNQFIPVGTPPTPEISRTQYRPQTLRSSIPLVSTTVQNDPTTPPSVATAVQNVSTTAQCVSTTAQNVSTTSHVSTSAISPIGINLRNLSDVYKSMFTDNSLLNISHPEIDELEGHRSPVGLEGRRDLEGLGSPVDRESCRDLEGHTSLEAVSQRPPVITVSPAIDSPAEMQSPMTPALSPMTPPALPALIQSPENTVSVEFNARYLTSNVQEESASSAVLVDSNIYSPHSDITITESVDLNNIDISVPLKPRSPPQSIHDASVGDGVSLEDVHKNVNEGELLKYDDNKSPSTHNSSSTLSLDEQRLSSAARYPDSPSESSVIEMQSAPNEIQPTLFTLSSGADDIEVETMSDQIASSLPSLTEISDQLYQLPQSSAFIPVRSNMESVVDTDALEVDPSQYLPLNEFMQTVPAVSKISVEVAKGSTKVADGSAREGSVDLSETSAQELGGAQHSPTEFDFVSKMTVESTQSDLRISALDYVYQSPLRVSTNLPNGNQSLVNTFQHDDAYPSELDILDISDLSTSSLLSEDILLAQMGVEREILTNDVIHRLSRASPVSLPRSEILPEMFVELAPEISPQRKESSFPGSPDMTSFITAEPSPSPSHEMGPSLGINFPLQTDVQKPETIYTTTHTPLSKPHVETSKSNEMSTSFPMPFASSETSHKSSESLSDSVRYMEQLDNINQLSRKYRAEQQKMLESYAKLKEELLSESSYVTASMVSESSHVTASMVSESSHVTASMVSEISQVALPSDKITKPYPSDNFLPDSSIGGQIQKQKASLNTNEEDVKTEKQLQSTEMSDTLHTDVNKLSFDSSSTESQAKKLLLSLFEGFTTPDMSFGNSERDDERLSLFTLTDESYRSLPLIKQFLASLSQSASQPTGDETNLLEDICEDPAREPSSSLDYKLASENERNKLFLSFFHDVSPEMTLPENSQTTATEEIENFSMLSLTQNSFRKLPGLNNYLESLQETPTVVSSQNLAKDVGNPPENTSQLASRDTSRLASRDVLSESVRFNNSVQLPVNVFSPSIHQSSSPTYIAAQKRTSVSPVSPPPRATCIPTTAAEPSDTSQVENCVKLSHSGSPIYIQHSMSSDGTMSELKNLKISSFSNDSTMERSNDSTMERQQAFSNDSTMERQQPMVVEKRLRVSDISPPVVVDDSREVAGKLVTYKKLSKSDSDTSELFTVGKLKLSGTTAPKKSKAKGVVKDTLRLLPPSGKTMKKEVNESSCSSSVDDVKRNGRSVKRNPNSVDDVKTNGRSVKRKPSSGSKQQTRKQTRKEAKVSQKTKKQVKFQ